MPSLHNIAYLATLPGPSWPLCFWLALHNLQFLVTWEKDVTNTMQHSLRLQLQKPRLVRIVAQCCTKSHLDHPGPTWSNDLCSNSEIDAMHAETETSWHGHLNSLSLSFLSVLFWLQDRWVAFYRMLAQWPRTLLLPFLNNADNALWL